ncbi:MAG TPA: hypothetical protein VLB83_00580 [Candidatus Paceibacterota bacterium]|nr:hypothetical protein [Candidatus Paceibacterota bacterium]
MTKEDFGRLGGASIGALLGNQIGEGAGNIAATVIGGFAGWLIGGKIGAAMDQNDQMRADQAAQRQIMASTYGSHTEQWTNQQSRANYYTNVTTERMPPTNNRCIERKFFRQYIDVYIDGRKERAERSGIACRSMQTGQWEVEETN